MVYIIFGSHYAPLSNTTFSLRLLFTITRCVKTIHLVIIYYYNDVFGQYVSYLIYYTVLDKCLILIWNTDKLSSLFLCLIYKLNTKAYVPLKSQLQTLTIKGNLLFKKSEKCSDDFYHVTEVRLMQYMQVIIYTGAGTLRTTSTTVNHVFTLHISCNYTTKAADTSQQS